MAETYNSAYQNARARLKEKGPRVASLEARFLLMTATGKTQTELIRDAGLYVPQAQYAAFSHMLSRRLDDEPLAYIIGSWEFYSLPLTVNSHVLIPRQDTEVLADTAIRYLKNREAGCRVLDLCTGSGCLALAMIHHVPGTRAVMLDASDMALQVARQNVRNLKKRATVIHGNVLGVAPASLGLFDLIVCNPPYIPTKVCDTLDRDVRNFEPRQALDGGTDGLTFYRAIAKTWVSLLKPNAPLMLELGVGQAALVREIFWVAGFTQFEVILDTNDIERVMVIQP